LELLSNHNHDKMSASMARPSFFWFLSEPCRAAIELGMWYPYNNLFKTKKSGDGHPVMVIPGFMSTESSTGILRTYLGEQGYQVHDWGLGRNLGKLEYLDVLLERIDELHAQTGTTISLVGWSLGGVFARQVAKERPHAIRQVITLGSPFSGLAQPNNAEWIYSLINGGKRVRNVNQSFLNDLPLPAPVPTTAIYSKYDGIVSWEFCIEQEEDVQHQNIEVLSSHLGMGVNISVLQVISNRLRQRKETWSKLQRRGIFKNTLLYPSL
jgi:alpha/beta superfamily hydrolase